MCNSIFIGNKTIPKAKDGEEFEITIKGVYRTDEDGVRKLDVIQADGQDVVSPEETECGCEEEHEDMMEQDAEGALKIFLIKTRKG